MTTETLLFRQIHPAFLQAGRPTSAAFRPTPKDQRKLSVYDGDLIRPAEAYAHYMALGLASAGVMAVTLAECVELDLPVQSSPRVFPEHAEIDFSGFASGQVEKKSKRLRDFAVARDWLVAPLD